MSERHPAPKACPFGRKHVKPITFQQQSLPQFWHVACPTCQATGPLALTEAAAIEAWNERSGA